MRCADCSKGLERVDFRGIAIHECPQCRGSWFIRDELRKAKDATDEDLQWLDFDPFSEKANRFTASPEHKNCPVCATEMSSLAYAQSGVIINKCQKCHGVWLHNGEFKKIIDYLESLIVSESSSRYAVDSFKKFLELFKKNEAIGSELKDFLVVLKLLKMRIAAEHPDLARLSDRVYEYLPFL
jgi:Zn-finger nucleic acid-binding protein